MNPAVTVGPETRAPTPPDRRRLPFYTRYTYHHHLRAELLNNLFLGVFGLFEAVARKGLHASPLQITLLTSLSAVTMLTGAFWSAAMRGRDKAPFFLLSAVLGRGVLLACFWITDPGVFVALCFVMFLADPIFAPAQNSLFQANYPDGLRGRLFGVVSAWSKGLLLVTSLGAGFLLDHYPDVWRQLFVWAGLVGFLSYVLYARTRIRTLAHRDPPETGTAGTAVPAAATPPGRTPFRLLVQPYRDFLRLLRDNPAFDAYERNFFIYGVAFMMLLPVNVLLLVDHFQLDYAQFSFARQVLFMGLLALFSPLGGRLLERYQTIRAAGGSFVCCSLHPLLVALAYVTHQTWLVYLSFAVFGVAMAGVIAAWNLGAIYFAGRRDSSDFMGVHVTCVGARGLMAPFLGYSLSQLLDLPAAYLTSSALFLLAGILMFRLARTEDRRRAGAPADSAARSNAAPAPNV